MSVDPAHRCFVSYIDRTREYYGALGYGRPYRWSYDPGVPAFSPLPGPLADLRVGIVITSYPPMGPGEPSQATGPYVLGIDEGRAGPHGEIAPAADVAWAGRRDITPAVTALRAQVASGRIGSLSPRFYGVPTEYSQRRTSEQDAPFVLEQARLDGVDAMVLLPYRPVCHQTHALVARHLEADGMPTVVIGSARDIVEQAGVARFLFTDIELCHPTGHPDRPAEAAMICDEALALLERAWAPRTTVQSVVRWEDDRWRSSYMAVDEAKRAELAAAGEARRRDQDQAKTDGRARTS
jgi:hypothetical protein